MDQSNQSKNNNSGGMFNILNMCVRLVKKSCSQEFEAKDIAENTGLCGQSVTNNLTRLVNSGYLRRHETRSIKRRGRIVTYSINPEIIEFIGTILDGD